MFRSILARVILSLGYAAALMVSRLWRIRPRRCKTTDRNIVVTGTFYNHNWFLSHARPLAKCVEGGTVVFVADAPLAAPDGVRFVCPPRWISRIVGRALAKSLWLFVAGVRYRPGMFMGYHLFPGALSVLIAARVFGRSAGYQMTGGPIEIIGGGCHAENRLLSALRTPSAMVERLAVALVREFDLVVVRGSKAKRFLADRKVCRPPVIITGSIEPPPDVDLSDRTYDLIFVGRLTEIKQPDHFVAVVASVARTLPNVRAVVVGDGPSSAAVQRQAADLGVSGNIEFAGRRDDVPAWLAKSKVFVLTSRSEGLSIAMAEAMGHGLPAVSARVGESSDLVVDGVTGWLVTPNAIDEYADRIVALLSDDALRGRMSRAARAAAIELASVDNVAGRWRAALDGLVTDRSATEGPGEQTPPPAKTERIWQR